MVLLPVSEPSHFQCQPKYISTSHISSNITTAPHIVLLHNFVIQIFHRAAFYRFIYLVASELTPPFTLKKQNQEIGPTPFHGM